MDRIDKFEGEYEFLSNFYPCDVEFKGEDYASTEHAYQAAKSTDPAVRATFRAETPCGSCSGTGAASERETCFICDGNGEVPITPGKAKKMGRKVALRPDWEQVKNDVMLALLREKFLDSTLRKKLLETGDAELVEGNWWGDVYWGVCKGVGENHLGRLLMQVRSELAKG